MCSSKWGGTPKLDGTICAPLAVLGSLCVTYSVLSSDVLPPQRVLSSVYWNWSLRLLKTVFKISFCHINAVPVRMLHTIHRIPCWNLGLACVQKLKKVHDHCVSPGSSEWRFIASNPTQLPYLSFPSWSSFHKWDSKPNTSRGLDQLTAYSV
ncbi:hypothetical protein Taro_039260 [Colocasia esculenta]|uniref:Uncharacterized protein n=1 Tax=Colocasia esculenta TaxID=4460 RepID=A0A843WPM8_COLES|nr:hypothetical protein [Colocasia esculenta]